VASLDIPVRHVRLGEETPLPDDWAATCGLGPAGALLVRPDQHIAWRSAAAPRGEPALLPAAIGRTLGR
jgi:hypothetical protein